MSIIDKVAKANRNYAKDDNPVLGTNSSLTHISFVGDCLRTVQGDEI
jgi:hypothetical protein